MKITFSTPSQPRSGTLVVGVLEGGQMLSTTAALDKKSGGAVSRAMKTSRFKGEKGQWLSLLAPSNLPLNRLVLLGIGKAKDMTTNVYRQPEGASFPCLPRRETARSVWRSIP